MLPYRMVVKRVLALLTGSRCLFVGGRRFDSVVSSIVFFLVMMVIKHSSTNAPEDTMFSGTLLCWQMTIFL